MIADDLFRGSVAKRPSRRRGPGGFEVDDAAADFPDDALARSPGEVATWSGGSPIAPPEAGAEPAPAAFDAWAGGMSIAAVSPAAGYNIRTLQSTGADSNRVDIVFMGDGYTTSDIGTTYVSHVQSMFDYLKTGGALTDPFGRYRNFFNVYAIDVVSNQSGADDPVNGITRDTALDATYRWDGVTDRLLYINETKANNVIATALSGTGIRADMRFVTVNATKYGGGGGYYGVYAGGNGSALEVAVHEIGHSYAGLADQYYSPGLIYTGTEPTEPDVTKDPTGAKWARWLGYNQPGIGVIGAYEGARYYGTGLYRPSLNSKMQSLGQPFDAIGQEQFILKFYSTVRPLDSFTSNAATLVDPASITVAVVDPAVISVRWSIDGTTRVDGAAQTFAPGNYNVASGAHTVTAFAYDPTTLVRADRALLQQTVNWNVSLQHAILRASSTNHTLAGGPFFDAFIGVAGLDTATYSIAGGLATITRNRDGSVKIVSSAAGEDTLTDMEWAQFTDRKIWVGAQHADGNNDGRSDFLWRNDDGSAAFWQMDGATILPGSAVIGNPGASWRLAGSGDFNGDRKADLLWQDATGAVRGWLMNGTTVVQNAVVANPGIATRVAAEADFNADGLTDIALQGTNGAVSVWLMNGVAATSSVVMPQNPGSVWRLDAAADFDADGTADLLFQHIDGRVAIWRMNGTQLLSGVELPQNPGSSWHIRGTGDFGRDGKADIVWQHDNGDVAVWAMNGSGGLIANAFTGVVASPGAGWKVGGVGDYNGDNVTDLALQNLVTGQAALWTMNGVNLTPTGTLLANPGTFWKLVV